uniref:Telomere length regulation protein TEL2 homolog n=1 Tax=Esox lucius TaxID=8010 RepID=A0A6Q2ZGZ1_ESOLU
LEQVEVGLSVAQCFRTLTASSKEKEVTKALHRLASYLDDEVQCKITSAQRTEFLRAYYTRTLQFLISNINADWIQHITAAQRTELWDGLFLRGPPDQALLVLMDAIGSISSPSAGLDHLVSILERFLQSGRLTVLLWSRCQETAPSDSPQLRETLLGRLVALPDLTANKLHPHNKTVFLPQQYYPLLASGMLTALERTCQALRDGRDCSLAFVALTLGKACVQGHRLVFEVLAPTLSSSTSSDMVWQRVCWKLLENVPERWLESVLTGLLCLSYFSARPDTLSRIMGNLVLKNKKAHFVITHKLLLLQYKYETRVLRVVLGYLADDRERRPLLLQVLRALCQAWANPSAVRHTTLEQQLYVSRALLLCVALLDDAELKELRSELLQCMLGGMQSHLDSSVVRVRRMGMVVGECLSSRMDIDGAKLKFEYEQDEETKELLSLLAPPSEETKPVAGPQDPPREVEVQTVQSQAAAARTSAAVPDSDLDSDDELTPYDMSGDQEMSPAAPPRYLRDCLEAFLSSEDPVRVELSLRAVEGLVRKNPSTAREVSVELSKVLLHMEDRYGTEGFLSLRRSAMVALAVTHPVTEFLTTEFYSMNYSLRQRLDMLEVLATSAQELSQPITDKGVPSKGIRAVTVDAPPYPDDDTTHWRQVVERRIQSKTKLLSKGVTRPPAKPTPNRFAPVAGHYFFPLLRNYDRPQVTFDLLGSDHLVLGRLIHTLGLMMHLAVNAPVATQMGRALLDFVWAVRYHIDQMVRRGVLFAVCSVFLSMPSQSLLVELSDQLFETRAWLADVAEGDPDADCRSLAVQSLVLLEKSLKTELDPTMS